MVELFSLLEDQQEHLPVAPCFSLPLLERLLHMRDYFLDRRLGFLCLLGIVNRHNQTVGADFGAFLALFAIHVSTLLHSTLADNSADVTTWMNLRTLSTLTCDTQC